MKKVISRSFKVLIVSALFLVGVPWMVFSAQQSGISPLAPDFAAVSLDGKPIGKAQLVGKPYVVNFFASWCPPCRSEIPDMVSLQNQYSSKGFTFIGVAVNESEQAIRDFISSNHISYPVVMATPQLRSAFGRYVDGGIRGIPTSFVVNTSGRITRIITGSMSKGDFEKLILEALRTKGAVKQ